MHKHTHSLSLIVAGVDPRAQASDHIADRRLRMTSSASHDKVMPAEVVACPLSALSESEQNVAGRHERRDAERHAAAVAWQEDIAAIDTHCRGVIALRWCHFRFATPRQHGRSPQHTTIAVNELHRHPVQPKVEGGKRSVVRLIGTERAMRAFRAEFATPVA